MYGAFDAWMVTALGGMSTVSNTTTTAWEHIVIRPDAAAVAKLQNGYNSMQTRFGPTVVYWRLMPAVNGSHAFLETNATIPVGSTAEIVSARIVAEVSFPSHWWSCGQVHDSRLELLEQSDDSVQEYAYLFVPGLLSAMSAAAAGSCSGRRLACCGPRPAAAAP